MAFSRDEKNTYTLSKGPSYKLQPNDQIAKSPLKKIKKKNEIKPQLHKQFMCLQKLGLLIIRPRIQCKVKGNPSENPKVQ
jgi:hypothetical protein